MLDLLKVLTCHFIKIFLKSFFVYEEKVFVLLLVIIWRMFLLCDECTLIWFTSNSQYEILEVY